MTTANQPKTPFWKQQPPPVCKDRSVSVREEASGRLTVLIREGAKVTRYAHERVDGADCDARQLTKLDDEEDHASYTVVLAGRGSSCECLGYLRWGHKTQCKHIAGLLALQRRGLI